MKPRAVTHIETLHNTALKSDACYVAMIGEQEQPYIVPMNFGLHEGNVYFHSAQAGKKITLLKKRPRVCVCFSNDHNLRWQSENIACSYGMKYRSVLAHGKVEFIEDYDEKVKALNIIMRHYTAKDFSYNEPAVNDVLVWRVVVEQWEGRNYGY
jgi:uncharacterized protein